MRTKVCFKCLKEKPIEDFYKHRQMADGYLNKCKDCTQFDVSNNYSSKREKYAQYEKTRSQKPERRKKQYSYLKSKRKKFPEKARAWQAVHRAVKNGLLVRKPCRICGKDKVQAHHKDYSKPLEVDWLCFKHHRETEHGQVVVSNY